jgi:MGT family glycosyltransferase
MSHFALLCPEHAGHLLSNGPVAVELLRRGHQVTLIALEDAAPLAEQLGLAFHPLDMKGIRVWPPTISWLAFEAFRAGMVTFMRTDFTWKAKGMLELLPPIFKDLQIDGLLCDQILPAGGTAAQRAGIPFVTICSALLWHEEIDLPPPFTHWLYAEGAGPMYAWASRLRNRLGYAEWHWFIGPALRMINRYRRKWGFPPFQRIDETFSPLAQISQLCAGFDFPRREIPAHFHYIGSLASNRQVDHDFQFPWDRLDGRPLIFASLGTVPYPANVPVFRKIAEACIGVDAQLVLALGKWNKEGEKIQERLGRLPGDHIVVDFAPQLKLLDQSALLITHAGVNTVLEAISRGVPMVALPRTDDQPGMGARIVYSGTGLRGSFKHSTAAEIRGMVRRVLAEGSFRQRAAELKKALVAAGGLHRAADIAEQALTSGRPMHRK